MKKSAGILLYRVKKDPEVFLVHPGGPFFAKKDAGAWSIPKGEFSAEEEALACARREFKEETGFDVSGNFIALTPIKQKGGKQVQAWAIAGDLDPQKIQSNTFDMEWPPKSGKKRAFPEIDRGEWFSLAEAKTRINVNQAAFVEELATLLGWPNE